MPSTRRLRAGNAAFQVLASLAILAGLILITVPMSRHELRSIRRQNCIKALAWVAAAKEEIEQRDNLADGATIDKSQLESVTRLEVAMPLFPEGIDYQVNPVGKLPSCVYNGETLTPLSDYGKFTEGETV